MSRLLCLLLFVTSACAQGSTVPFQQVEGTGRAADAGIEEDGALEYEPDGGGSGYIGIGDGGEDSGASGDAAPACVAATEVCNGIDDDCDGAVDDGGVCPCDVAERDGHAYLFCSDELSWTAARMRCQTYGYDLAVVENAEDDAFVYGQISARTFADTWIGMNDTATEGTWVWIDGTPFVYTGWDDGEPNNGGTSGEDCGVIMTREGRETKWDDRDCPSTRPFVCETL